MNFIISGYTFVPRTEQSTDYTILKCHHEGRCAGLQRDGIERTCRELAACELLEVRCRKLARAGKCVYRCSACDAAVAG